MKAVVMEKKGDRAVVLSESGEFRKVPDRGYRKGQTIELSAFPSAVRLRAMASVAAVLLFVLVGVSGYAYFTPYSVVSLDVNPALELILNRFERVLSVQGWNGEGEMLANQLQLRNKSIDEALMIALQQMLQAGYLGEDGGNGVMISAAFKNHGEAQSLAARLMAATKAGLQEMSVEAEVESEGIGFERVEAARELGITPGKLNLLEKLQASADEDDAYTIDEWKDASVKEIMQQINSNRKEEKGLPGPPAVPPGLEKKPEQAPPGGGKPDSPPAKDNNPGQGKGN